MQKLSKFLTEEVIYGKTRNLGVTVYENDKKSIKAYKRYLLMTLWAKFELKCVLLGLGVHETKFE